MALDEVFARIPEGWFQMGSDEGADEERPVHRVWVEAFDFAVYPVTCRAYARFLRASDHEPPRDWTVFSTNAPVGIDQQDARCRVAQDLIQSVVGSGLHRAPDDASGSDEGKAAGRLYSSGIPCQTDARS